jgi:hypothetical protein
MTEFFKRIFRATFHPETFFQALLDETSWSKPFSHLFLLALWLSFGSVIAWSAGMPGDTPINSSLGAQMDVYPYWRDTLLPQYGVFSYPLAMGIIMLEMFIISFIWIPIVFLAFRFLGGQREPWQRSLLHAAQGFIYGLSPCAFGGFLPYLALLTGVYATLLQFFRGPAITLQNKTFVPYLFVAIFLAFAILRYWQGALL